MNRRTSNQRRFEDAIRRLFQRGAGGQRESDITRYKVLIDRDPYLIGERTNEIIEGKTVSTYTAQLDDSGSPFSHVKDFILCSCGCKINIKAHKVRRCFFCKQIVCEAHSTKWRSKNVTFCNKPKCYILGRFFQLIFYTYQLIKFSISMIFGLKRESSHPTFPSEKWGVADSEDNEKEDRDFKGILRGKDRNVESD